VAVGIPPEYERAIARWGHLADAEARKYGETGESLLAKLGAGESGFRMEAVSSAGARAAYQFMPGTRAEFVRDYSVDPWRTPDEAVHGAALFLRDRGLAGYNPGGGQSYIDYILGQQVTGIPRGRGSAGAGERRGGSVPAGAAPPGQIVDDERRSTLVRFLLTVVFVLAGLAIASFGSARAFGLRRQGAAA
jgi:Transglycosylase SLT domain